MREKPNHLYTRQVRLFYHELGYIRLLLMTQVQSLAGDLHRDHLDQPKSPTIFANNSRLKRATDMGVVSLCLYGQDASTDLQYDLLGSTCDLMCP